MWPQRTRHARMVMAWMAWNHHHRCGSASTVRDVWSCPARRSRGDRPRSRRGAAATHRRWTAAERSRRGGRRREGARWAAGAEPRTAGPQQRGPRRHRSGARGPVMDTSAFVAALVADREHHALARPHLAAGKGVAAIVLAETFAQLRRTFGQPAAAAASLLAGVVQRPASCAPHDRCGREHDVRACCRTGPGRQHPRRAHRPGVHRARVVVGDLGW